MGLVFNRGKTFPRRKDPPQEERYWGIGDTGDLIPRRLAAPVGYAGYVNHEMALTNSAVWAAVTLRADLVSTLPITCFRYATIDPDQGPIKLDAPLSPFMANADFMEFVYSSQESLDTTGNAIGIILEADKQNWPTKIELHASSECVVNVENNVITNYRIGGIEYDPKFIWHEKQYTASGLHVGMSPIAKAAYTLGQYRSVQEFAVEWFTSGRGPRASLKNTDKKLSGKEAMIAKEAWRASQNMGEPFVHGSNWEYNLIQAEQASADWLDAQKLSLQDVSRFFKVPADLIDAALAGGPNITYANVTQRNLQFLIMHLGPAIRRRENAFTNRLLPRPRQVQFNTDDFLRMDPKMRAEWIKTQIEMRMLAPSEAREMYNRKPFTLEQMQEFDQLGLNKVPAAPLANGGTEPAAPEIQNGIE